MKNNAWYILLLFWLLSCFVYGQQWSSKLLKVEENGKLLYLPDSDGFFLPDFSHAGYKGGGVELPKTKVVSELSPIEGDNTGYIQNAIDEIGELPVDENGMRGTLLLKAGIYDIRGTLKIASDGVVLRGEDKNRTILKAIGNTPHQRDVIVLGNPTAVINGLKSVAGTHTDIIDEVVPVGALSFEVQDGSRFEKGDRIIIYHPATESWLRAVNYGGVPYPDPSAPENSDERWSVGKLPIVYNRYITKIEGNRITLHAPLFYSLHRQLSQSYVYKPDMNGLVYQVGLENLTVDIHSPGGTDENHAWQAARFRSCENSWATDCIFKGFGQSGIITEACMHSTFRNCEAVDPVGIVTGERMYNFNTYSYSQLNLFDHCYARNGRHHYVSNGTSTASGNVFLHCISDNTNNVSEGHRQWTQGMLFDNHCEINMKRDFVLGLYNRVAMGTGHGWAAVGSVLWNCDVNAEYGKIALQKPPTSQNYAIGCKAKSITGKPINASDFQLGYVEGQNKSGLFPSSLYEAQLVARQLPPETDLSAALERSDLSIKVISENNALKVSASEEIDERQIRLFSLSGIHIPFYWGKTLNEREIQWSGLEAGIYFVTLLDDKNLKIKCLVY